MTRPVSYHSRWFGALAVLGGGWLGLSATAAGAHPCVYVVTVEPRDGGFGLRPIPWPHHIELPQPLRRHRYFALKPRRAARPTAITTAPAAIATPSLPETPVTTPPVTKRPEPIPAPASTGKVEGGISDVPKVTLVMTPEAARERAADLMAAGQITAARGVLGDPAVTSDARVLTALAATYDPIALAAYPAHKGAADREQAIKLYRQAAAMGDEEAIRRLTALYATPAR